MNLTGQRVYAKPTDDDRKQDQQYLSWIRTQPSAYSGMVPSIAAHYRTAENSGTGTKPLFSAIPLTRAEHEIQHRIGTFNFSPREWWEEQVRLHLERWRNES